MQHDCVRMMKTTGGSVELDTKCCAFTILNKLRGIHTKYLYTEFALFMERLSTLIRPTFEMLTTHETVETLRIRHAKQDLNFRL